MEPFQGAGLALVVAAIVGGGLKAAGFEIGAVRSLGRQLMLGGLGGAIFLYGTPQVWTLAQPGPPPAPVPVMVTSTQPPLPTATQAPNSTPQPSPTSTPVPSATPAAAEAPQPAATAASGAGPATAPAPATAPLSAPAPDRRTPVLPAIRKDGPDRRP